MPDQPQTAAERATERAKEYGTYTAVAPIDHYGARAYNVGDPVAVSAVEGPDAWVTAEQVAKVTTKAGQQAVAAATDSAKG